MRYGSVIRDGMPVAVVFADNSAFALDPLNDSKSLQEWLREPDALKIAAESAIAHGERFPISEADICAPVLSPQKILGIGLNYHDHAKETGREAPTTQTWFVKQASALNRPFGDVEMPMVSDRLDYEVELVVVIGRGGRHIPAERASEAIAGYTVGCDYSVRDWQRATPTMIMGKGFDTHAPVGPWIVTEDEIENLNALGLRTFVNGDLRQDGRLGDLIHKIPDLIAHLSKAFTLMPGDLIFTGTPAGVGVASDPPRFLKAGDTVRVEIDEIGSFENHIIMESGETRIGV